jgi:hypothetical protein
VDGEHSLINPFNQTISRVDGEHSIINPFNQTISRVDGVFHKLIKILDKEDGEIKYNQISSKQDGVGKTNQINGTTRLSQILNKLGVLLIQLEAGEFKEEVTGNDLSVFNSR